jgi:hypothetical protein
VEGVLAGCGYIKQLSGVLFLLFCLSPDTSTLLSHSVHLDRHCVACKYSINMAASENVSPPPSPLKIRVGILPRHRFCDLSGRVPFQISGNVARVTLSDSPIDYENHIRELLSLGRELSSTSPALSLVACWKLLRKMHMIA